jgi:hypothetical protein
MFPHCNINKYTWASRDGKTHNQTDVLTGKRRHSNTVDIRSFREFLLEASREDGLELNTEKTNGCVSSPKFRTKSQFTDC